MFVEQVAKVLKVKCLFEIAFQDLCYFLYIFQHKRFYCTAPLNGFAGKGTIINMLD